MDVSTGIFCYQLYYINALWGALPPVRMNLGQKKKNKNQNQGNKQSIFFSSGKYHNMDFSLYLKDSSKLITFTIGQMPKLFSRIVTIMNADYMLIITLP